MTARTASLAIHGPIRRADLPGLSARVCALLEATEPGVLVCDVADVDADAVTVEALLRFALAARRRRCVVRLRGASAGLRALVTFMGVDDVLRPV